VLLRGLGRSKEHWGPFLDRFRAAFSPVLAPDLPGAGVRHGVASPASVGEVLASVRAELGGGGPRWLVGLSLGGMVVDAWTRAHPGEVAGAVLINTSVGGLARPWQRVRPAAARQILVAIATTDPLARERRIYHLTSNRPERTAITVPGWAALAQRQPVSRANVLRQLLAAARHRAGPPSPAPTLILASTQDRLVDPACSRALAAHLGAPLQEHPTAGHDLPLDEPDWVVDRIREWEAAQAR
jgi:pimeloyl-ACP methyl ester carboxylesterase